MGYPRRAGHYPQQPLFAVGELKELFHGSCGTFRSFYGSTLYACPAKRASMDQEPFTGHCSPSKRWPMPLRKTAITMFDTQSMPQPMLEYTPI